MRFSTIGAVRTIAVAIGLTVATLAYASAQGSTVDRPIVPGGRGSPERSAQASEVEAAIATTNLAGKLEAALGDSFGGVWFQPATAEVHVGVTSLAGRRRAEGVAARVGLAGAVTEVAMRSSWAELQDTQRRWGNRLADLFERAQVATWLSPQHNAVEVELVSSVSSSRRSALKHTAALDGVNVEVIASPRTHLRVTPQARCEPFKSDAGFCDPPIVGGMTIKAPAVKKGEAGEIEEVEEGEEYEELEEEKFEEVEGGKSRKTCTAGVTAILKDPANPADATKTYLLTAGHCINPKKDGGGVGGKWDAYPKKGKAGELEIGPAVAFLDDKTDVGVIEMTPGNWTTAKDPIPVTPTIAPWDQGTPEPVPVVAQVETPVVDTTTCISGQISGLKCGKIIKTDQVLNLKGKIVIENLKEVQGVTTKVGDSGSPWFTKGPYQEGSTALIEGTHVGLKGSNGVFQGLTTSFAELASKSGLSLELLTYENMRRHPALQADKYPATASAKDTTSSDTFTAFGTSVKCTENEFDGVVNEPEGETAELEVKPGYGNCTTAGSLPAKFTSNECKYKFTVTEKVTAGHYKAELGIVCPGGSPGIQFHVYASESNQTSGITMCKFTVPPQSGLKTVTLTDNGGTIVADTTTLEKAKVKIHRNFFLCPSSGTENETTSGTYQINEPLSFAGSSEKEEVELQITGG